MFTEICKITSKAKGKSGSTLKKAKGSTPRRNKATPFKVVDVPEYQMNLFTRKCLLIKRARKKAAQKSEEEELVP